MPAPPAPFVPAEFHGRLAIVAFIAFAGDDAAAERAIAPFRSLSKPIADMVKPGPYLAMYPPEVPDYRPTAVARTMFVDGVDLQAARTIHEHLSTSDAPMRVAQVRVLGGAMARVPADATAFAHRSRAVMVNVASQSGIARPATSNSSAAAAPDARPGPARRPERRDASQPIPRNDA